MSRRRFWIPAVLALAAFAPGCGSTGPPLVPVHGRVKLDGKPLAGKSLKFVPEKGTPGLGGGGTTNEDGGYTVIADRPGATRDMPGLPAGAYRVVVVEPMFPLATAIPEASPTDNGAPPPAMGLPTPNKKKVQDIPAQYGKPETTPLRVEVPEGGEMINFDVEGLPPTKK